MATEKAPFPSSIEQAIPSSDEAQAAVDNTAEKADRLVDRLAASAHSAVDMLHAKAVPLVDRARSTASSTAGRVQSKASDLGAMEEQWIEGARSYVRENPLTSVAVAAVIGMVIAKLGNGR
jgi:ElaB/YqjD/DUF883 family membrane-anchored ribosome-binding protein